MKIGIFDSGLGGLFILKSIIKKLPNYDFLYLGDTQRTPYGNRSPDVVYQFTKEAVDYLFKKGCFLIILACNTASSLALRKIQREYLPKKYPKRRVLGVIIPTIEEAIKRKVKRIGVLATQSTVASEVFKKEIKKNNPQIKVFQKPAPLLVPLIENNGLKWATPILKNYLKPLIRKKVEIVILGCTHYPLLKNKIRKLVGSNVKALSQDEIIPQKLLDYFKRHPEIEEKLTKKGKKFFEVTDLTIYFQKTAQKWFGENILLKKVSY